MTPDLRCYGDDIQALAALVPDVDLRSPMDIHGWYRGEWQHIAEPLGFAQQLAAAPTAIPTTADRAAAMILTGLAAFERSLHESRAGVTDLQARAQSTVLQQLTTTGHERGELWRVTADPTTLSTGACYAEGGGSLRAFYPDTAPGYFGEGWPGPPPRAESACGWTTPLVLHLGTFPWVYSSRLEAVGPGMRWTSPSAQPALEGLYAMGSLMEPATNLRQDARQVAAIFRHFTAHTAPLLARIPRFPSSRAPRLAACTGAAASCMCIKAASTSPASTARAAASRRPPTTMFCAASPASSRSVAPRCGPCRRSPPRSSSSPRPRPTRACASMPRRWPVQADHAPHISTRGTALLYPSEMRSPTILLPLLFILADGVRCKDDAPAGGEFGEPCGGDVETPCADGLECSLGYCEEQCRPKTAIANRSPTISTSAVPMESVTSTARLRLAHRRSPHLLSASSSHVRAPHDHQPEQSYLRPGS
jgi:hypothetical protein